MIKANESEQELRDFLQFKQDGNFKIKLLLRGPGDSTTFDTIKAVNIVEINCDGKNTYIYGGITEKFYDKMVEKFDTRTQEDYKRRN